MKIQITVVIVLISISGIIGENRRLLVAVRCRGSVEASWATLVLPGNGLVWRTVERLEKEHGCGERDHVSQLCRTSFGHERVALEAIKYRDGDKAMELKGFTIYECVSVGGGKSNTALRVPTDCRFNHTERKGVSDAGRCEALEVWQKEAETRCGHEEARDNATAAGAGLELYQWSGLFPCSRTGDSAGGPRLYSAVQFVCCPPFKLYELYKSHKPDGKSTVVSENRAYQLAKKALRDSFRRRQKEIKDRFVQEENSINIWDKHPKMASTLEKKMQKNFANKFRDEMNREEQILKDLEIFHGNIMQKLFEKNRRDAEERLKYTLQETQPQAKRIADALKLELNSIISEAEDITKFHSTLIKEGLEESEINKELIRENFYSLMNQSWDAIIKLLDQVPSLKNNILKDIENYNTLRETIFQKFNNLNSNLNSWNSMKNQTENYVKNIISVYQHDTFGRRLNDVGYTNDISIASRIVIIFLLSLSLMLLIAISLLLYRFHGKINSYLSSTFKKIHPPNKSLLVQVDNYPFKNRFNYGNRVYQPYFKSEESIIGNPNLVYNQHFSSVNNSTNEGFKKSSESDFNDSSISNINGLENPICRLLDEK